MRLQERSLIDGLLEILPVGVCALAAIVNHVVVLLQQNISVERQGIFCKELDTYESQREFSEVDVVAWRAWKD